ncbi:hypothetical protein D3C75_740360 [compost metagenome]
MKLKTDLACHTLTKCLDNTTRNIDLTEVHELNIRKIFAGNGLANRERCWPGNLQLEGLTLLPSCIITTLR